MSHPTPAQVVRTGLNAARRAGMDSARLAVDEAIRYSSREHVAALMVELLGEEWLPVPRLVGGSGVAAMFDVRVQNLGKQRAIREGTLRPVMELERGRLYRVVDVERAIEAKRRLDRGDR